VTKAKISEYSATAGDNTDVNGTNIAEGCAPSGINDAIREVMAALKRFETGADGDSVTVGGNLVVSGSTTANTLSTTVLQSDTISEKTSAAGVTIDGVLLKDNGVVTGAGTVSAPVYSTTGDTNTGIFFPAADTIAFTEGGVEAMRIDSSGNVGIGVTSPSQKLVVRSTGDSVVDVVAFNNGSVTNAGARILLQNGFGNLAGIAGVQVDNGGGADDGVLVFSTAIDSSLSERARITAGGYFKASNTGGYAGVNNSYHELVSDALDVAAFVRNSSASPYGEVIQFSTATPNNTTNYFLACEDTSNQKAVIWSSGTFGSRSNSYTSLSDIKLKQDIVDASSQWDDIKNLRVRKFRMKDEVAADPNYPSHIGLIAQEAELVSPGLVFESPDMEQVEVTVFDDEGNPVIDEEGNPQVTTERQATGTVTKSVKYSILYMKAVKALQEAMKRIETLEAKVSALEAK